MEKRLVHQLAPSAGNPRNSEGDFARLSNGDILFAYSRYSAGGQGDHSPCDIYYIRSRDEGETWSEPTLMVSAASYGVENIMSVSSVEQKDGRIGFYYLIKENDFTVTLGRSLTSDGEVFFSERCGFDCPPMYYTVNNDRIVRLKDGRLAAPASVFDMQGATSSKGKNGTVTVLLSEDDGENWHPADFMLKVDYSAAEKRGLQEPGLVEFEDRLWMFIRTGFGCQYQSTSTEGINGFKTVEPTDFSSPRAPMQVKGFDRAHYAVYNPIPNYDGRLEAGGTAGRTPFVIRKSLDGGETWGPINVIWDDPNRGYSYPALFQTRDGHLMIAHGMGGYEDGGNLCRIGITKLKLDTIE